LELLNITTWTKTTKKTTRKLRNKSHYGIKKIVTGEARAIQYSLILTKKNNMKANKTVYIILFIAVILLYSCQSKIDFTKSKQESNKSLMSVESISSYSLRFNPKANGTIVISLSNGAEYKADKLNSSQLSSLLTLLQNKEIKFDTKNEEFVLN
jgi:hypothetical protein